MRRGTPSCPSQSHLPPRPSRRLASASARGRRAASLRGSQRSSERTSSIRNSRPARRSPPSEVTPARSRSCSTRRARSRSTAVTSVSRSSSADSPEKCWRCGPALRPPHLWLPLAAIFLAAFFDPRRPCRLLHLDLAVLLAFGLSQLYFNQGRIDVSMPIVYPLLAYLAVRTLLAGFRPRERSERLVPRLPVRWMAIGLVLLVACRVGLNLADSNVIDVGYASVVGADRIVHGEELYVPNDVHGDTYGPVNYLAYVPFELIFPWDGTWDSVPAAHAAAITFDLLTIVGLMLLGTTLRP